MTNRFFKIMWGITTVSIAVMLVGFMSQAYGQQNRLSSQQNMWSSPPPTTTKSYILPQPPNRFSSGWSEAKNQDPSTDSMVRIPINLKQITPQHPSVRSTLSSSEGVQKTLRAALTKPSHFMFESYHIESIPLAYNPQTQDYEIRLSLSYMSDQNSITQHIGYLDLMGQLENQGHLNQPDHKNQELYLLVGQSQRVFHLIPHHSMNIQLIAGYSPSSTQDSNHSHVHLKSSDSLNSNVHPSPSSPRQNDPHTSPLSASSFQTKQLSPPHPHTHDAQNQHEERPSTQIHAHRSRQNSASVTYDRHKPLVFDLANPAASALTPKHQQSKKR